MRGRKFKSLTEKTPVSISSENLAEFKIRQVHLKESQNQCDKLLQRRQNLWHPILEKRWSESMMRREPRSQSSIDTSTFITQLDLNKRPFTSQSEPAYKLTTPTPRHQRPDPRQRKRSKSPGPAQYRRRMTHINVMAELTATEQRKAQIMQFKRKRTQANMLRMKEKAKLQGKVQRFVTSLDKFNQKFRLETDPETAKLKADGLMFKDNSISIEAAS